MERLERRDRVFTEHRGVGCDACGTMPIVGSRYVCTNIDEYDLYGACYGNDAVSKHGLQFRECRYVWEKELGDALVPPAPLRIGGRGPPVTLLQKRLTDLGFLNETLNTPAVGRYGPNTRMAVLQFQREHGARKHGYGGCVRRRHSGATRLHPPGTEYCDDGLSSLVRLQRKNSSLPSFKRVIAYATMSYS